MADASDLWNKHAPQPWRRKVAPRVLEIVLQRARDGTTITYGELATELNRRFGFKEMPIKPLYGQAIGAVGFALQDLGKIWGELIPPINTIVVNKATTLPGDGADYFLKKWLGKHRVSEASRDDQMRLAMKRVFDYPDWERVGRYFGIAQISASSIRRQKSKPIKLPKPRQGGKPESAAHKELKRYTAACPNWFSDFGKFPKGENELVLQSGDRLDVFFSNGRTDLAVEVKASNASDSELVRGVFQCVKYREVLRATQLAEARFPNAQAVLVSTRKIDSTTAKLLKLLQVRFIQAPIGAEQRKRDR